MTDNPCDVREGDGHVLSIERIIAVPREKLNVNGGSLAAGHPFAATGGRLIAGLAKELHARGGGTGLLSVCAAGGLGVVALVSTDPTLGSKK